MGGPGSGRRKGGGGRIKGKAAGYKAGSIKQQRGALLSKVKNIPKSKANPGINVNKVRRDLKHSFLKSGK